MNCRFFIFSLLFLLPILIFARTIHVPTDSLTIQSAIQGAEPGDTVLVAPGVYTGEGNRRIEFLGKAIVLISEAGPEQTTIDGEGAGKDGFYIHQREGASALISGFRVINCFNGINLDGNASPWIFNCILENNLRGLNLAATGSLIEGCIFRGNSTPGPGGGILDSGNSDAMVKNCLIAGNISANNGGGILVRGTRSALYLNCTIVGNRAQNGGGILVEESSRTPELVVRNCIVWGNEAERTPGIVASGFDITYSNIEGGCWPGRGNISMNPQFEGDLYQLGVSSPCIDAGDPNDEFSAEPDPNGSRVNMGTYGNTMLATTGDPGKPVIKRISPDFGSPQGGELDTIRGLNFGSIPGMLTFGGNSASITSWTDTLIVCTTPAHPAGNVEVEVTKSGGKSDQLSFGYRYSGAAQLHVPTGFATIQSAINCAQDGDTVWVAPGVYTGEGNRRIELLGKAIVLISEAGPEQTTIDGEGAGEDGFFIYQGEERNTLISGFRIINCDDAIYLGRDASPQIANCILENNGRGIQLSGTGALVETCIIRRNSTTGPGAGILDWGSPNAIIKNCLIAENTSANNGGGILLRGKSAAYQNCTIVNNTAIKGGGVLVESPSSSRILKMRNCIVWGNTAQQDSSISSIDTYTEITYSAIEGGWAGTGNIDRNPVFKNRFARDYHLHPSSPCIDAGDPNDDFSQEPAPNGGRIDMGAFGNTSEATSFKQLPVMIDFQYNTGCIEETTVSLKGLNFGMAPGIGGVRIGDQTIDPISTWSDSLVIFTVPVDLIGNDDIILSADSGQSDTLSAQYIYSPIINIVSGEVSGVWTAACPSVYLIVGNVKVPSGRSLVIEPGVTVLVHPAFAGNNAQFVVEGSLTAQGTETDSIVFSVWPELAGPGTWAGLRLSSSDSRSPISIQRALIEYAKIGITMSGSFVSIESSVIRSNSENGVLLDADGVSTSGLIRNNLISNNGGWGIFCDAYGSSSGSVSINTQIIKNRIEKNRFGGIKLQAIARTPFFSGASSRSASVYPAIVNNVIEENLGFAISCFADGDFADGTPFDFRYRAFTSPRVEGNIIANNAGAIIATARPTGNDTHLSFAEPSIINCTFWNNGPVDIIGKDSARIVVINSIFWGEEPVTLKLDDLENASISYSNFQQLYPGEGNISEDPLFFDPVMGDFRILARSSSIDAGQNGAGDESLDFLGNSRISDGNGDGAALVDQGALEYTLPVFSEEPADVIVCAGEPMVSLRAEGQGNEITYQWLKDGQIIESAMNAGLTLEEVSGEDAGAYQCLIVDELGGEVLSTAAILVVYSLPEVTLPVFDTVRVNEAPFMLTSGQPIGGLYEGIGVVGNHTFDPALAGLGEHIITYTFVDDNGCSAEASASIFIDQASGLEEWILDSGFYLYPNPAIDHLEIFIEKASGPFQLGIFDSRGRLLMEKHFNYPSTTEVVSLDILTLSPGIYWISLVDEAGYRSRKLVVSR